MKSWKEDNSLQNIKEGGLFKSKDINDLRYFCKKWNIKYQIDSKPRVNKDIISINLKDFTLEFIFNNFYLNMVSILGPTSKFNIEGKYFNISTTNNGISTSIYDSSRNLIVNLQADGVK